MGDVAMPTSSETAMSKVLTTIVITNRADQSAATRGYIAPDQVRSVTLENVLVDTGATTLCLPADTIAQLELELLKEVDVATANGFSKARIFQDANIDLMGRKGTFECFELPSDRNARIGFIPLEALGVELDLRNQQLKLLPEESVDTYLTIL